MSRADGRVRGNAPSFFADAEIRAGKDLLFGASRREGKYFKVSATAAVSRAALNGGLGAFFRPAGTNAGMALIIAVASLAALLERCAISVIGAKLADRTSFCPRGIASARAATADI